MGFWKKLFGTKPQTSARPSEPAQKAPAVSTASPPKKAQKMVQRPNQRIFQAFENGLRSTSDVERLTALIREGEDKNNSKNELQLNLLLASMTDHAYELAQMFLSYGANINGRGNEGVTALILASGTGSIKVVQLLISKEADVNAKLDSGATALMLAELGGHHEIKELLLKAGAK